MIWLPLLYFITAAVASEDSARTPRLLEQRSPTRRHVLEIEWGGQARADRLPFELKSKPKWNKSRGVQKGTSEVGSVLAIYAAALLMLLFACGTIFNRNKKKCSTLSEDLMQREKCIAITEQCAIGTNLEFSDIIKIAESLQLEKPPDLKQAAKKVLERDAELTAVLPVTRSTEMLPAFSRFFDPFTPDSAGLEEVVSPFPAEVLPFLEGHGARPISTSASSKLLYNRNVVKDGGGREYVPFNADQDTETAAVNEAL